MCAVIGSFKCCLIVGSGLISFMRGIAPSGSGAVYLAYARCSRRHHTTARGSRGPRRSLVRAGRHGLRAVILAVLPPCLAFEVVISVDSSPILYSALTADTYARHRALCASWLDATAYRPAAVIPVAAFPA